jgi:predicted nucleotide-binding protein (sugar kinase/HSP70/actin superfamily)
MGEGWLLTAEMLELCESGYENIVCTQPFGCLPNHINGKGMIGKIRKVCPTANITPIDYDPSATKVNQENRIKLMLAVARENLEERVAADTTVSVETSASNDIEIETKAESVAETASV